MKKCQVPRVGGFFLTHTVDGLDLSKMHSTRTPFTGFVIEWIRHAHLWTHDLLFNNLPSFPWSTSGSLHLGLTPSSGYKTYDNLIV